MGFPLPFVAFGKFANPSHVTRIREAWQPEDYIGMALHVLGRNAARMPVLWVASNWVGLWKRIRVPTFEL